GASGHCHGASENPVVHRPEHGWAALAAGQCFSRSAPADTGPPGFVATGGPAPLAHCRRTADRCPGGSRHRPVAVAGRLPAGFVLHAFGSGRINRFVSVVAFAGALERRISPQAVTGAGGSRGKYSFPGKLSTGSGAVAK